MPFWINTRCDYEDDFMKKIKNWLFNPQADEEDEWPIEPRFNSLLHSTMISDNRVTSLEQLSLAEFSGE